jgi:hypothetical protein
MRRSALRTATSLLSAALLAACASMSKDECVQADWNAVGLEDGAACPAPQAFLAGYQRGRELFDLYHQRDGLQQEIARTKSAITAGLPTPAARAREVERLEELYREADQLEARIRDAESR